MMMMKQMLTTDRPNVTQTPVCAQCEYEVQRHEEVGFKALTV